MSEAKFTEGEWAFDYEGAYHSVWSAKFNHPVAIIHNQDDVVDYNESEANAYLIAAAPEMYEMLERLKWHIDSDSLCLEIEELLAKARGESND